jgi:hypothetical protein
MSLAHFDFFGNGDFIRESVPFGSVNPNTVVVGSITEIDGDGLPFVGAATLEPRHGAVLSISLLLCCGTSRFDFESTWLSSTRP